MSVKKWILIAFATGVCNALFAQQPPVILKADNYIACPGADVFLSVEHQNGVIFDWYTTSSGGSPFRSADTCTVFVPNGSFSSYTVWVQPRTGLTRTPVTITQSQSCGGTPVSCAVSGTLLFKEDFSGNDPALDPAIKTSGIPQVDTIYKYTTTSAPPAGIEAEARYSINKYSLPHSSGAWYRMDDHTYPNDITKGYMLQVNASHEKGQFYEVTINGLCSGTKLYFSAWLVSIVNFNITHKTNQTFTLEDNTGHIIAQYSTGEIQDASDTWKQYGFEFTVPTGITSLTLRIINNGAGSSGNDFCLDDIEIHFCSPLVTRITPLASDTTLCPNVPVTLNGSYSDDGTFGNSFTYRWERSLTGDPTNQSAWTPVTENLSGTSPLNASYNIPSMSVADTGYYRLVVGTSINQPNCCATSEPVRLRIRPLKANPDYATTISGNPTSIDVLFNDNLDTCSASNTSVSVPPASAGGGATAFDINKKLIYTPPTGFSGRDSVEYTITCGSCSSTAKVYFIVLKPKAENYIACPGATVILELEAISSVSNYWYDAPSGGNYSASPSNTFTVTNVAPPYTVWVEPRQGGISYPRVPVTIQRSFSCGRGMPRVDCAVNGTLLFKEDFGGNDPDEPLAKPTGIPQVDENVYTYTTASPAAFAHYSIRKQSGANSGGWYIVADHTHPGDFTKGYMLQVDAADSPGQFYEAPLTGLCPGMKLYFSAWLLSVDVGTIYLNPTNQTFTLEDNTGRIIARYYTGNIPDDYPVWEQYGFEFTVPSGVNSLTLRIINNGTGSNGNDFCMDDIEIHFCSPPVILTAPSVLDTVLCQGAPITLSGTYTDDGTFGSSLTYRWEHSLTGDPTNYSEWTAITADSSGTSPLSSSYVIPSMSVADTGYYRLVVGTVSSISQPNCRATSEIVHLRVRPLKANIDYATAISGNPTGIDVLFNDNLDTCSVNSLGTSVTTAPASGGTASFGMDKKLIYTPPTDFSGQDSMEYTLTCGNCASTAKVYITVSPLPDNIDTADCYGTPVGFAWDIREIPSNSSVLIHNYGPLIAGDIDGDKTVEIIGNLPDNRTSNNYESDGIRIFYVQNEQVIHKKDIAFSGHTASTFGSMAMARYYNGTDTIGYIVVCGVGGYLYAYDAFTGLPLWVSDNRVSPSAINGSMVNIADFNGDGIPEVYSGNRIFSLATGNLLCEGGAGNNKGILVTALGYSAIAADITGDGLLELCAGTQIYKVYIPQGATTAVGCSMSVISDMELTAVPPNAGVDGATVVADIDCDGRLEVIVTTLVSNRVVVYVWKPLPNNASYLLGSYLLPATSVSYYGIPMIGNIDDTPYPEIVFIANGSSYLMYALKYDPPAAAGSRISLKWNLTHTDGSGCTGMSLFDFNQDGKNEIVYRDETDLRILDGSGLVPDTLALFKNLVRSGTLRELPVIADIDGDGQAEIIVTGHPTTTFAQNGYLRVYKSGQSPWAPARKVWNQYAYNAVNINEDLTVPPNQINPATFFPNSKQPYNGFLMQQTMLNTNGDPLWRTPNIVADSSITSYTVSGTSVDITVGIINRGDADIVSPLWAALYRDVIAPNDTILTVAMEDVALFPIHPGDTAYATIHIPDMSIYPPFIDLIIRLNDDGQPNHFPVITECIYTDDSITLFNPYMGAYMKKEATLPPSVLLQNGTYANPVSVLYSDTIEYKISAVNANRSSGTTMIIHDTIPYYLKVNPSTITMGGVFNSTTGMYPRDTITWTFANLGVMESRTVSFKATPVEGVAASQPLFVNRAWITASDTLKFPTNNTYHQGAGVSILTFSASFGGSLYNAQIQVLDYRTSPKSGVLVVPDEGYVFAGWSHEDYRSLRGELIRARSGIMLYDTLTVYGDVTLRADFEPEMYPITYYLNGSENAEINPRSYTIQSPDFVLSAPEKWRDVFIGWTGSNGDEPQLEVIIPAGSTGERVYYANFLHSGRETRPETATSDDLSDRIWVTKNELNIYTSKAGSIVRIFTPDGVLHRLQPIVSAGETKIKLPRGIYIVTLNNNAGRKIAILEN